MKIEKIDRCKIKSVEIVPGSTLKDYWKSPMQIIKTDIGDFIDNMPGVKFMGRNDVYRGFKWQSYIGKEVKDFRIIKYGGFEWINKKSD